MLTTELQRKRSPRKKSLGMFHLDVLKPHRRNSEKKHCGGETEIKFTLCFQKEGIILLFLIKVHYFLLALTCG